MPKTKKILVQEHVSQTTARALDALAKASGCSRSRYVATLLQTHVRCMRPKLLKSLNKTVEDRVLGRS